MAEKKGYTMVLVEPGLSPTTFHLDPAPEETRSEKTALTTLIPLPNLSMYRESHGNGIETLSLQGTFGYKKRQVGGVVWTGAEMFLAFRKGFWDKYLSLIGSNDPNKQKAQVEFHNWDEDEHWYCEPTRFVTPRGTDNRTFFRYELTLSLYAPIQRKFTLPVVDKKTEANRAALFFARVLEKLREAGELFQQKIALFSSLLNRNVLQPLAELTDAINSFVSGVTTLINFPIRAVNRIGNEIATTIEALGTITGTLLTETANSLRNVRRMTNRLFKRTPELFVQTIADGAEYLSEQFYEQIDEDNDSEAVKDEKRGGRNIHLKQQAEIIKEGTFEGAQRVTIRKGDTLHKMAVRYLGDVRRWRDIALLNAIDDPDISSLSGMEILVPTIPSVEGTGVLGDLTNDPKVNEQDMAERLYGRDLQVVAEDGRLSVVFGSNNDLATIGGNSNLIQAVTLKTKIKQGQLLENVDFGLRQIVGEVATQRGLLLLKHGLQVAAESDPRVEEAEVSLETTGNETKVSYLVHPVGVAGSRPVSAVASL